VAERRDRAPAEQAEERDMAKSPNRLLASLPSDVFSDAMRQFESIPHSQDTVHPTCAKCGAPMWLTRIEPDFPHHEKRTFECKACGGTRTVIVKYW